MYLTAAIDEDASRATERLNAYLEQYYCPQWAAMRGRRICYAGPSEGLATQLQSYADAGASHLVLRFAGHHERHLKVLAKIRAKLAW